MLTNYHTDNAFDPFAFTRAMDNRFSAGLRCGAQAVLVAFIGGKMRHVARIQLAHTAYSRTGSGLLQFFSVPELGLNANMFYVHKATYSWNGEGVVLALLQKCFNVSCQGDGYKYDYALDLIAKYFKLETYTIVKTIH